MDDSGSVIKKAKRLKPAHIIVLGFLGLIFLGAVLLHMPFSSRNGEFFGFMHSLFTATSAVCVTGLIVVDTATQFTPIGQVIVLLLIQIGGLGFMSLTTMIMVLLKRKITLKDRLVIQEALNQDVNKGIVRLTRNIVLLTLFVELIGALLLMPAFIIDNGAIGVWQAIFGSVSAFCNAGFDILGTSTGAFSNLTGYATNVLVCLSVCMLIILGGMGFTVIMDVFKRKFNFKKFRMHSKIVLVMSGALILFGWVFFFAAEFNNPATLGGMGFGGKVLASLFQSVSPRTAGFNTIDLASLTPASKTMTMIFMFIGASPGSTGGGIKTTTLAILIMMVVAGIKNDDKVVINKHSLSNRNVLKSVSVMLLSLALVMLTTLILLMSESGHIPKDMFTLDNILFEAFSAFGTVGLSMGITPYLSPIGQFVIMLLMFFGRVGPVTIGLMFLSKNTDAIRYPEGSIMIG